VGGADDVHADWVARGIAIAAAAIAAASLAWNVIAWRRQGPVIRVRAVCTGRGDDMKITGGLSNKGRFDAYIQAATITWASFQSSSTISGARIQVDVPPAQLTGITLGKSLPAQTGAEFTVTQVASIDPGLSVALHDRRQVAIAFRTATGKTAKRIVKYK
jgi:hypothetical protein